VSKATHASLTLARFDDVRETGPIHAEERPGTLFLNCAADVRAAASDAKSQHALKFALYGLHDSEVAASQAVADRFTIAPWFEEANELWSGVLQPFRHFGEANFVNPAEPGGCFDVSLTPPADDAPVVIMTSVGWDLEGEVDWEPIKSFGEGVTGVRIGMTAVPGLHSQQSFSFPGGLVWDGITVTFWKNLASTMNFAYGPGLHRTLVKKQRGNQFGARTSFTRFIPIWSEGTWHGSDPFST